MNTNKNNQKDFLIKSGKLPGYPTVKKSNRAPPGSISVEHGQIIKKLPPKDIKQLLGKGVYPLFLDLSPIYFQIEDDEFLLSCPNVVKELDLTSNALVECKNLTQLSKLKRLWVDNNLLCDITFKGLHSLETLSLSQNRLERLSDTTDLKKLVYLDLSGNRLTDTFSELGKLKNLRVLDLGTNSIGLAINEFYNYILIHLKKLPKLEYISFLGNPIEDQVTEFRLFVVNELPKLKYYDWEPVTKEDRSRAHKLEGEGVWDDHLLPLKAGGVTRIDSTAFKPDKKNTDKSRMLEMLLDDGSRTQSEKPIKKFTLDDIIGGNDPLDDILNQLASTSASPAMNRKSTMRLSTPNSSSLFSSFLLGELSFPSFEVDDMPLKTFDDPPVNEGQQADDAYLEVLSSVLKASNHQENASVQEVAGDYLEKLEAVIKSRGETVTMEMEGNDFEEARADDVVEVNYLDLLDEMMEQHSLEIEQIKESGFNAPIELQDIEQTIQELEKQAEEEEAKQSFSEDSINKLIASQADKLDEIMQTYQTKPTTTSISSSTREVTPPWESSLKEVHFRDKIGVGSSITAQMWKAIWRGYDVTVKKIEMENSLETQEYIKEQTKQLIPLRHKRIIPVLGCCCDGFSFLISEYMSGLSLYGLIHNKSIELDVTTIVKIAKGIVEGLSHLHQNETVHRALKPKNVILDHEFYPLIRDFGYCAMKDEKIGFGSCELGDVEYLAPEILRWVSNNNVEASYDEKVDVYAFGVVLWQMFAREDSYHGLPADKIVKTVLENRETHFLMRGQHIRNIPVACQKLIVACLSWDPEARPSCSKIIHILNQPAESLMQYGNNSPSIAPITPRSTAAPPRIKLPTLRPSQLRKNEHQTTSPANSSDLTSRSTLRRQSIDSQHDAKLKAVVTRIKELLVSPSVSAQINAARAMASLANVETNVQAVVDNGLVFDLIKQLTNRSEEVQENAAVSLAALMEYNQCRQQFRAREGFSHLIPLMEVSLSSYNESLLLNATKLLTRLVRDAEGREAFRQLGEGGVSLLIEELRSTNEFVQIQTVWALSHLLEDVWFQNVLLQLGGLSPLLKLLLSSNPGLQIRVLNCLGRLIVNEKAQDRLLKAGVLTRFLDLLSSNSLLLQQLAVKSIADFADNVRIREELVANDAIPLLFKLLSFETSDEQVLSDILKALRGLTNGMNEQVVFQIRLYDGLSLLVKQLVLRSNEIITKALYVLANLAEEAESRENLKALGTIQKLDQFLGVPSGSDAVQDLLLRASLTALEPFAFDELSWGIIRSCGIVERLVQLLGSPNADLRRKSAKIVSELARDDQIKTLISNRDGIPSLINLLLSSNQDTQESATFAISFLSDKKEERQSIVNRGGVKPVIALLGVSHKPTVERAVWTLANLALDAQNQTIIVAEALPTLLKIIPSSSDIVQSFSLKLILILAQNASNKQGITNAGTLKVLQQLTDVQNKTVQLASKKAISLLSSV